MRTVLLVIIVWQTFSLTALGQTTYPLLPDADYRIQSLLINRFTSYNRAIIPFKRSLVFIQPVTEDYYLDKYRLTALKEQIAKQGKLTSFVPDSSWVNFIMTLDVDRFKKCTVEDKFKLPSKNTTIFTQ